MLKDERTQSKKNSKNILVENFFLQQKYPNLNIFKDERTQSITPQKYPKLKYFCGRKNIQVSICSRTNVHKVKKPKILKLKYFVNVNLFHWSVYEKYLRCLRYFWLV